MRTTLWTKAVSVLAGTLLTTAALAATPANAGTWASDDCAGGTTVVDTFTFQHYVAVHTASPDPATWWTCVRIDASPTGAGGKFAITLPSGTLPGVPYTDSNAGACTTTAGNQLPGAHPIESGALGDPSDPTYTQFLLDAYLGSTEAWVCVRAGAVQVRVVVPLDANVAPAVSFTADPIGEHAPPAPVSPGLWSSACGQNAAADGVVLFNGTIGTTYVLLAARSVGIGTSPELCVRVDGPVHNGGILVVYPSHVVSGALAAVKVNGGPGSCSVIVASLTNPDVVVSRSPTGTLPASICLTTGGTTVRLSLVNEVPLVVEWLPDAA
jgi:hypothetical protein